MPSRTFTDLRGVAWTVWEVHPGEHASYASRVHLPAVMADGWLCFESESEKRRLYPVPPGWVECEDDALVRLCDMSQTVAPRVRRAPD